MGHLLEVIVEALDAVTTLSVNKEERNKSVSTRVAIGTLVFIALLLAAASFYLVGA